MMTSRCKLSPVLRQAVNADSHPPNKEHVHPGGIGVLLMYAKAHEYMHTIATEYRKTHYTETFQIRIVLIHFFSICSSGPKLVGRIEKRSERAALSHIHLKRSTPMQSGPFHLE